LLQLLLLIASFQAGDITLEAVNSSDQPGDVNRNNGMDVQKGASHFVDLLK
jgi:hypothetical protein